MMKNVEVTDCTIILPCQANRFWYLLDSEWTTLMSLLIFVRGLSRVFFRLRPYCPLPRQDLSATGSTQVLTSEKKRVWFPYTPRHRLEKSASPSTDIKFHCVNPLHVVPNSDDSPRGGERGMSRDWKHVLASFSRIFKIEKEVQAAYGQLGK